MKASTKLIRKKRYFSEDFKKRLVSDFESGRYSVCQLEHLHRIDNSLIYKWIYKYSSTNKKGYRVIEMTESSTKRIKELEKEIKALKGIIGEKQIRVDFLEKMIEIAEETYKIDIKKK